MKNLLSNTSKYLLLAVLATLTLSACGGEPLESPEAVMDKAKQVIVDTTSGSVDISAKAEGSNGADDLLFEGEVSFSFDKKDPENQKLDLQVDVSGDLRAAEKSLNGDLDFELVILNRDYYVKLNELASSDESLTAIKPFVDLYTGKWLQVAEDFIPQDIRDLQGQDEEALLKKEQLEELFVETRLFNVVKEYGIEKLNGQKVYHYGVAPNLEGFKNYMTKAAIIDGRELTLQEIEEAVKVLSYVKEAELYIDSEDYYLLKSVFSFTGEALNEDASLEVKVVVEGSDFNKSISIEAPEGAEDFNPLNLIMGMGALPTAPVDAEGLEGLEIEMEGVSEGAVEADDEDADAEDESAE